MREEVGRAVHTHPGPEIFYLLTGDQCLETPNGAIRARAGVSKRDAFFVIIHDSTKPRVIASDWQPKGTCNHLGAKVCRTVIADPCWLRDKPEYPRAFGFARKFRGLTILDPVRCERAERRPS